MASSSQVPPESPKYDAEAPRPMFSEDEEEEEASSSYWMTLVSNMIFVIGCALYEWLGLEDFWWQQTLNDLPDDVLNADDDTAWESYVNDDDNVFRVVIAGKDCTITRYMILNFVAAWALMYVGILEWIMTSRRGHRKLGCALALAGAFGVVSATLVERNVRLSLIFNALSVHFFAIEAVIMIRFRSNQDYARASFRTSISPNTTGFQWLWFWLADTCFATGAFVHLGLSYGWIFAEDWGSLSAISAFEEIHDYELQLAKLEVFASSLWLVCSVVYFAITVANYESPLSVGHV